MSLGKAAEIDMNKKIQYLAVGGLLVAVDILCARFLYFYTPGNIARISMQFLPNALSGLILGPIWGAVVCVCGDIVGMLLNSGGLVFTPLITMVCAVRGVLYGLVLHKRKVNILRCILATGLVIAIADLGMMPVALMINYASNWSLMFVGRLILLVAIPIYGGILFVVARALERAGIIRRF